MALCTISYDVTGVVHESEYVVDEFPSAADFLEMTEKASEALADKVKGS